MTTTLITDASIAWKLLNGIFISYKPAGISSRIMRSTIQKLLCKELNEMHVRPPTTYVCIEGETNKPMTVSTRPSFADNILAAGPRYQEKDIKLFCPIMPGKDTSGVVVTGIGKGTKIAYKLLESKTTRHYKLKGTLGQATNNYFISGKIVEKSTYKHVRRHMIDKICASMQSSHQRKMFEQCGVDMESQAAFELAVQGPIRPATSKVPVLYSIKCIDFESPEFTLEIVCLNEYEDYLKTLIHELGMKLHTTATCTQIQCFQYGLFNVEHALLKKHWKLEHIIHNIQECQTILDNNEYLLHQKSASLLQQTNSE
ncbi:mitochondrial mRNA pseudouridine synthase Trub2 isoform X1 [Cephus cinctus]|uniref:Mitochondrial mRNA pseudouridine synthase Trub2 isoform X1 n=1 Tax=Cephus cinctus TaxID=211228 RepID=A0AAJ7RJC6_CEPCN|nr:mitochondrial mRNA pseudouridine synthase Trub2 isoform X1 [Cephus cinctus]XP_015596869.1 mitochondrial mRNA pseudouridine synthase Trub2 isoform X1 [Cephus cinctus]XP_015596871.1 mitochondrial mRNA pseudouridine synthase Trub2 isoform X1 [Cephus cinctus]XP_024941537.1 mitochondrial mRNA pseudouridine synthase Trub2 isoform X1 [Cephus cinctus]XP_024941538.1 mitochondrial mRNA pseudouridine synthase Trub2 isoform X1 [Cephus cinctus]